jgi:dipeptidyl-peptidase-4
MKSYEENEKGYSENSPIYFVDQLSGNYLLVHGMADDNVHFQHSAEMINALVKHKKRFDLQVYPNRNHSIQGDNVRYHLYEKMTNFVLEKI